MIQQYLLALLVGLGCCNLALALVWVWRQRPHHVASATFHPPSYNLGLRDAGEILRDIRIECGIPVGENLLIEEAFDRIRKAHK